jgi:hypothetical protein
VPVIELDYAELGIAWQRSKLPRLSPVFTWRSHASMPDDPQQALRDAEDRLRARGLIERRGGLDDDLYGVLALFALAPVELDLRFAPAPAREIRACVAARDSYAARVILDGDRVRIDTVPDYSAIASLVGALPDLPPCPGVTVSVPTSDLDAAVTDADRQGGSDAAVEAALRARGVRSDAARGLTALIATERTGYGTFGAAARDSSGRRYRDSRVVKVLDTARGRVAMFTRSGYTTAAPADTALLVRLASELLEGTQRRAMTV